jgi:thiol:disulfide interchange protein
MQHEGSRPDHFRAEPAPDELEPAATTGSAPYLKWLIIVLTVAGLGLAGWKVLGSHSIWLDDVDEGLDAAQMSGKPVVMFYTADWCPPCRQLKSGLLKNPGIQSYLSENYVPIKIDLTDRSGPGAMRAGRYGVTGIPTIILYDSKGQELDRFVGGEIWEWLVNKGT